eukprot:Pgem_evm1s10741
MNYDKEAELGTSNLPPNYEMEANVVSIGTTTQFESFKNKEDKISTIGELQDFETEEDSFDPENPNWSKEEWKEIEDGLNWRLGVTPRAIIMGIVVGILCTFMLLKIILWNSASTPGWSLPAVLISYVILKLFHKLMARFGRNVLPMSKYELVCIQTITVAITSVTSGMGYGTYFAALLPNCIASYEGYTYEQVQANSTILDNLPTETVAFKWVNVLGFAACLAFTSVNLVTVLRKMMIVHYRLPFPSPSATALLITSFVQPQGKERERKINIFAGVGGAFFLWACLSWVFAGAVEYAGGSSNCSAFAMPVLGLTALRYSWYFNANAENLMYGGIACLTPRNVNFSSVIGSIFFFGLLYPIIWDKGYEITDASTQGTTVPPGYWFVYGSGINFYSQMGGYSVFFMICCVLGNGCWIVVDMAKETIKSFIERRREAKNPTPDPRPVAEVREEALRVKIMEESTINKWILLSVFLSTCVMGIVVIPFIFPFIKWYMVLLGYIIFPIIAIMNVYLTGLTDQGITFLIAKGLIFAVGSWFNSSLGEYEGFPALMVFLGIVAFGSQNSSDIMGDYKTAFILKASSTSMYISEMIGLFVGCFISPTVFYIFQESAADMGFPSSAYPISYAPAYIGIGHIALEGFGALPKYATTIGCVFFICAFVCEPIKEFIVFRFVKSPRARKITNDFWPNWMVMGLYAYLPPGDYMIPLFVGWISCEIWLNRSKTSCLTYRAIIGAAIIVGVNIWGLP